MASGFLDGQIGDRCLRDDLGFEVEGKLTLRHLAAHVTHAQYTRLHADYEATLRQAMAVNMPG